MARKVVELIRKQQVKIGSEEDACELVNLATNQRRPAKPDSSVSNNPFGGFKVLKPTEGAAGMAQGGMGRQKARPPRFATAISPFASAMPVAPPRPTPTESLPQEQAQQERDSGDNQ